MKKQKASRYQIRHQNKISLETIAEEATLYGQSMRQFCNKAIRVQEQIQYEVLEALLSDSHKHFQYSPLQILVTILEGAQKQEDNFYEASAIIQNITQTEIFKMLIKCIQCGKCNKNYLLNIINQYNKLLKVILYHQRYHLSSLQDYKWFMILNELLLDKQTNNLSSLDSLWNLSTRQLIKEQQQNLKKQYAQSKKINSFLQINENQNEESILKKIKTDLRIYEMSVQLLKVYLNSNKKCMVNFYDKYIRHSNPSFLLTIGKLINCTYNLVNRKDTNSQFQYQIILPLTKKIQNSNSGLRFQFKPLAEKKQKFVQLNTPKNTQTYTINQVQLNPRENTQTQTINQVSWSSRDSILFSLLYPSTPLLNTSSLKTVEQIQSLFDQLLNSTNKHQQKKYTKQQIVNKLKDLKIKNLKGSKQKKIKLADLFLDVSSRQPALVGSAFQNSLIYFDISQLPKKIKEHYQSSPREVIQEYEKQRKKRRNQLKVLYDSFKID